MHCAQAPAGSVDAGLRDASCGRCRGVGTSTASKWRSPRQQPACGRISARHSPRPLGHRAVRARDAQSTSSRGVGGCHRRPGKQHCAGPPTPRPPRGEGSRHWRWARCWPLAHVGANPPKARIHAGPTRMPAAGVCNAARRGCERDVQRSNDHCAMSSHATQQLSRPRLESG